MLATERPPPMGGRMRRLASLLLILLLIGSVDSSSLDTQSPPSSDSLPSQSPDDVIKQITNNISMYCTAPPPQRVASDHGFYVSDDMNTPLREKSKITNQVLVDFIKALMNMELGGKIRKFFAAFSMTPVGANLAVTVFSGAMSLVVIVISIYLCISYKDYGKKEESKKTKTAIEKSIPKSQASIPITDVYPTQSDNWDLMENQFQAVSDNKVRDVGEKKWKDSAEGKSKDATERKSMKRFKMVTDKNSPEQKSKEATEKKVESVKKGSAENKSKDSTEKKSKDKTQKKSMGKSRGSMDNLPNRTPTASKESKKSKEKSRLGAGKDKPIIPKIIYNNDNNGPIVPGPNEDDPVENFEMTGLSSGLPGPSPLVPVPSTPIPILPTANTSVVYETEARRLTKAYEEKKKKVARCKFIAYPVFTLILLCLIGASVLFGASIMTYLNTEATRVSLVQDQVHSLRTELAKIACQSSPPEVVQKFNEIATEKKMTSYIVSLHKEVEEMYPNMAYSKLEPVMVSGQPKVAHLSFVALCLRNAINVIDPNNEASRPIVANLSAMETQIKTLATDFNVDWDAFGASNQTLSGIVTSTVQKELSELAKKLSGISESKDPNFIRNKILSKLRSLLNKDFIVKAVNESGLYGNPFWTYLTLPLFIVAAIFAFQTACTCCHNSRLYYFAAIVTSLCVITSGVALNQGFGGLQNACHYLEHEIISIENTTLSLASSKWDGFETFHGSIASQCGGEKTYGEMFEKAIKYAVKQEFDGMRKKSLQIIDGLTFSNDYASTINEIATKLTNTNDDIGAGIELVLKINKDCSVVSDDVECGFNTASIVFKNTVGDAGLEVFKAQMKVMAVTLKTMANKITKNPFVDVLAQIKTLQDLKAYKNHLRSNIKNELDRAEQSVTDLLKRKMTAKCHFTTIYHNIVRRACDPVMKPTNALINVNYVVAFGFPLCGLVLLVKGYTAAYIPRLKSLRTKKEKTEKLAEEASNVQAIDGGDMQMMEEPLPMVYTSTSQDYVVLKGPPY